MEQQLLKLSQKITSKQYLYTFLGFVVGIYLPANETSVSIAAALIAVLVARICIYYATDVTSNMADTLPAAFLIVLQLRQVVAGMLVRFLLTSDFLAIGNEGSKIGSAIVIGIIICGFAATIMGAIFLNLKLKQEENQTIPIKRFQSYLIFDAVFGAAITFASWAFCFGTSGLGAAHSSLYPFMIGCFWIETLAAVLWSTHSCFKRNKGELMRAKV